MNERRKQKVGTSCSTSNNRIFDSCTVKVIYMEGWAIGFAEGRLEGHAESILEFGTRQFGRPSRKIREAILSIQDRSQLVQMTDRAIDAKSWNDLLNDK